MTSEGAAPGQQSRLRCGHCGRSVRETQHTRTSYRVDYYGMHTGETEAATVSRLDGDETFHYLKLIRPIEMVCCADCYGRPAVREERERLFRPERASLQE